jgi:hypothetical protein
MFANEPVYLTSFLIQLLAFRYHVGFPGKEANIWTGEREGGEREREGCGNKM